MTKGDALRAMDTLGTLCRPLTASTAMSMT